MSRPRLCARALEGRWLNARLTFRTQRLSGIRCRHAVPASAAAATTSKPPTGASSVTQWPVVGDDVEVVGNRSSGDPASEPESALREAIPSDYDVLLQLWRACGIHLPNVNLRTEFERKLERDPELFLVAEGGGQVVGSVMGSYDGRRGWIGRLCVHPDRRRAGLGTRLVREVECRLAVKGCPKVNLLVESDNPSAVRLYQRLGYTADDLIFMERWLPGRAR